MTVVRTVFRPEVDSEHSAPAGATEAALTVAAIGDSTLTGQALPDQRHTWLGQALQDLATEFGRPLRLVNAAEDGARLVDMRRQLRGLRNESPHLIVMAVGTNDVRDAYRIRPLIRFRRTYRHALRALTAEAPYVAVAGIGDLSLSPRFVHYPRLLIVKPLAKWVSRYLDRQIVRAVANVEPPRGQLVRLDARLVDHDLADGREWLFTSDHFHPNVRGHRLWAEQVAKAPLRTLVGALAATTSDPVEPDPDASRTVYAPTPWGLARIRLDGAALNDRAIVYLPDSPNVLEHYDELIEILKRELAGLEPSERPRLIGIEMPGTGMSTATRRYNYSLRAGADWIRAVLDHEEIGHAVIGATCINGLSAAKAAQIDDRVKGLVVGQTPPLATMQAWVERTIPAPLRLPVVGDLLLQLGYERLARAWYGKASGSPALASALIPAMTAAVRKGAEWRLVRLVGAVSREVVDPFDHLGQMKPVRIWGSKDKTYCNDDPKGRDQAHDLLDWEVGHFPDLEAGDQFGCLLVEQYRLTTGLS